MVDYIVIGISIVIFIFYLMTIFMSVEIKRSLNKEAGTAFVYFILAIIFLTIRRVVQIFLEVDIVSLIPYFVDYVTLIFAILLFIAMFHFYRSIKVLGIKPSERKENKELKIQKNLPKKQQTIQKIKEPEKNNSEYLDLTK